MEQMLFIKEDEGYAMVLENLGKGIGKALLDNGTVSRVDIRKPVVVDRETSYRVSLHRYLTGRGLEGQDLYEYYANSIRLRERHTQPRLCDVCGEDKPLIEYYKKATESDGLDTMCKGCRSAYNAERYLARKESKG